VSVKRNPGKHTHEECGANGYTNVRPRTSAAVPPIRTGENHTLRAELRGENLSVVADGALVWEGPVGRTVKEFDGPVGLRTDNARFAFDYYVAGVRDDSLPPGAKVRACHPSPGD
jgi:hypothetical protein